MSFDKSVFINCPFDRTYNKMLHSMIFTIVTLGYSPRLSLESSDAAQMRLDKIMDIICESKFSIHDLSKIKANRRGEFARMNMAFELGVDFGCRKYGNSEDVCNKKFLIIGSKHYDYMKALSDISGIDIQYHDDKEDNLIKSVRHWFVTNENLEDTPSPKEIWWKFMDFNYEFEVYGEDKGYSKEEVYEIPIQEQVRFMKKFLGDNPF